MVKNLIIFIVGVGVGSTCSYFYFKEKIKEEEERKAQEEIDKIKEFYAAREPEEKKEEESSSEVIVKLPEVPGFSKERDDGEVRPEASYSGYYKKVENYIPSYLTKEKKPEVRISAEVEDYPKEGLREKPYIIDDETFRNTAQFHSKETLFYYQEGDVLADEEDIPVDDPRLLVGEEFKEHFDTDDRVFVRNDRAAADFEIVLVKGDED